MNISVQYLSFYVIPPEGTEAGQGRAFKHYRTLDEEGYHNSEIKEFLDDEFAKIIKRKAERHPKTEEVPTKIGRFITEPGYGLDSNPNYNMFARLRSASNAAGFRESGEEMVRAYVDTPSVRSGAFIVVSAKLPSYFDEPLIFVLKCDFEQKIASIADESRLVRQVEMAINAKYMKSILYPFMPEIGMLEEAELKIHQASHARYFEDFLKFVAYEQSLPEIINGQVMGMVQQYIEEQWEGESEERAKAEQEIELWAASEERDIQQKWNHEQVMEASDHLIEQKPDLEMKFRLDHVSVKALLADYGDKVHIARTGSRYVVLIEGDSFQFDRSMSPVELLAPEPIQAVLERIGRKSEDNQ